MVLLYQHQVQMARPFPLEKIQEIHRRQSINSQNWCMITERTGNRQRRKRSGVRRYFTKVKARFIFACKGTDFPDSGFVLKHATNSRFFRLAGGKGPKALPAAGCRLLRKDAPRPEKSPAAICKKRKGCRQKAQGPHPDSGCGPVPCLLMPGSGEAPGGSFSSQSSQADTRRNSPIRG